MYIDNIISSLKNIDSILLIICTHLLQVYFGIKCPSNMLIIIGVLKYH